MFLRFLAILWVLSLAVYSFAEPAGQFSDSTGNGDYNCKLTLLPAPNITEKSAVKLILEWKDDRNYTQVSLSTHTLIFTTVIDGVSKQVGETPVAVIAGKPYQLTLLRRGDKIIWLRGGNPGYSCEISRGGEIAAVTADAGWTVKDSDIEQQEPVVFTDDFMRTAEETGQWTIQSGDWALQSGWDRIKDQNAQFASVKRASNPFAWAGRKINGTAYCTTGESSWENYTFNVAICPNDRAAGVMVNMPDPHHGILVKWSPATGGADRLSICNFIDWKITELQGVAGGFLPGQWYKMSVASSTDGIQVSIDGKERLSLHNPVYWRGGIGLYAEGTMGATFDDVSVYGAGVDQNMIADIREAHSIDRFYGQTIYANQRWYNGGTDDWVGNNSTGFFHGMPYYGDQRINYKINSNGGRNPLVILAMRTNGKDINSGYRAAIEWTTGKPSTFTLYRENTVLKTTNGKMLTPGEDYNVSFSRTGTNFQITFDDEKVLETADPTQLTGAYPGFLIQRAYQRQKRPYIVGAQLFEDMFENAPVSWRTEGTWEPAVRWSCSPEWSFLAGWSRENAALWYKWRIEGDQMLDAFVGIKTEYPHETQLYEYRYRDFGMTICGDGQDPKSGYSIVFNPVFARNSKMPTSQCPLLAERLVELYRNGVKVASVPISPIEHGYYHRWWLNFQLQKQGDNVIVWFRVSYPWWYKEERKDPNIPVLVYKDPQPLTGGIPAIWTTQNALAVSRVRISSANIPVLRTDPQFSIGEFNYPEYVNKGASLPLAYPIADSTLNKPLKFTVVPGIVPAGDENAVALGKTDAIFTPRKIGMHWYKFNVTDGKSISQAVHIELPVYDPALKRDDSHAVLLYRFNEGKGNIVTDQSPGKAPLNLTIPKEAEAVWNPKQGLAIHGTAPLKSVAPADKLMKLAKTGVFTVEFWLSPETLYPLNDRTTNTEWLGVFFTWEKNNVERNMLLGHSWFQLKAVAQGEELRQGTWEPLLPWCFQRGMQHIVFTCNSGKTRCYINGKDNGDQDINWQPSKWVAGAPIYLGNESNKSKSYIGTYYLMAVHDRYFSQADVTRNYQAGPEAK
ncbi:MAG: LamG-like jellyroll fold domain-containing protein [bacterium]